MPRPRTEICDVWAGPATYAEDFYAGGDIIGKNATDPSRLTPAMEGAPAFVFENETPSAARVELETMDVDVSSAAVSDEPQTLQEADAARFDDNVPQEITAPTPNFGLRQKEQAEAEDVPQTEFDLFPQGTPPFLTSEEAPNHNDDAANLSSMAVDLAQLSDLPADLDISNLLAQAESVATAEPSASAIDDFLSYLAASSTSGEAEYEKAIAGGLHDEGAEVNMQTTVVEEVTTTATVAVEPALAPPTQVEEKVCGRTQMRECIVLMFPADRRGTTKARR
jgi:hypothetical protein